MTETTNPTPSLEARAEKIKADLTAMLLKAAKASAQNNPAAAAATAAPEQKSTPTAQ